MGRKAERFKRVISVRKIIPTRSHLTPNLQKKIYVSPFCMLELPATNTRPKVMRKSNQIHLHFLWSYEGAYDFTFLIADTNVPICYYFTKWTGNDASKSKFYQF